MTPWTAAGQAPLYMGFPRQEYWSGLPCPPPRDLPNPGIESRFPTFQADSLLSEPPEKPKNTGIGCHALLQGIFPTWELNLGLLHCRWILYQLSHQGSPLGNMLLCKMYVHMHTPTYLGGGLVAKSCWILATSWTAAHQAPQSIKFLRQKHWSGLPFRPPGDLPNL